MRDTRSTAPYRLACALSVALASVWLLAACSQLGTEEPAPLEEPRFQPGEYGGDPLPGTEALFNLVSSPSGDRIALIRE